MPTAARPSGKRNSCRRSKPRSIPKTGFAAPTPAVDGQRVYAFFDEPGLVALDLDGRVVWKRRLGPFDAPYNMGSSPVLYKDLVIQCCDHHGPSFLAAFERRSGEERWRTARPSSGFGHFGTPLVIDVGGRPQVVVNGEPVAAYAPDTGAELWSCRGMKECVAPSPVFGHGLVYASSGRTGPVMAIDPTGRGDVTETHVRLHLTSGGPYVPTPLLYPHLLVPGDNGRLLLYSGTHQRIGDERVRDHFTASPVAGDGKIYWASERGRVYVIDAARLMGDQPSAVVLAVNQLARGLPGHAGHRPRPAVHPHHRGPVLHRRDRAIRRGPGGAVAAHDLCRIEAAVRATSGRLAE